MLIVKVTCDSGVHVNVDKDVRSATDPQKINDVGAGACKRIRNPHLLKEPIKSRSSNQATCKAV